MLAGLTTLDTLQSEEGAIVVGYTARTQHERAVMNNIAYMECLSENSRVLTKDGWKSVKDVVKGEYIMQYEPSKNSFNFTPIKEKSQHIPEEMYLIENRKFSLETSGGHRMYYEEKETKINDSKNEWKHNTIDSKEYDTIPKNYFYRNRLMADSYVSQNDNKLTYLDRLIIAIQADGSMNKERMNKETINKIDAKFNFKKEPKINRLKNIVNKIDGVTIKELSESDGNKRNFVVNMTKDLLFNFKENKLFSDYFDISSFNQTMAIDFIKELSHWDSHVRIDKNGIDKTIVYYTASKENSDFVMAISTLACLPFTYSVRVDDRKDSYKDSHIVTIRFKENSKTFSMQGRTRIEKIEPKMVYGVEVESTFIPVLTEKGLVITGNCIHAKSYSTIFSTLRSPRRIDEIFKWTEENKYLQYKASIIKDIYDNGTHLQKRVASVFLESFLFYSGFFTPLYYVGMGKMSNVAEIIKLIVRDEAVHGTLRYKHCFAY